MKITIEVNENECAITTDDSVKYNRNPAEAESDDHIRFGDVVACKSTLSNDIITGIVIDIRDGNAAILYKDRFNEHLEIAYRLLDYIRRLDIVCPKITEGVIEWLAN